MPSDSSPLVFSHGQPRVQEIVGIATAGSEPNSTNYHRIIDRGPRGTSQQCCVVLWRIGRAVLYHDLNRKGPAGRCPDRSSFMIPARIRYSNYPPFSWRRPRRDSNHVQPRGLPPPDRTAVSVIRTRVGPVSIPLVVAICPTAEAVRTTV